MVLIDFKNLIKFSEYQGLSDDIKCIKYEGINKFIYNKLTSTKFRTKSIPENLKAKILFAIDYAVSQNKPVHLSIPFGGYKKWQYPTSPHLNWAEVFNILNLREYVKPIIKFYKPGVLIEYVSDEIFIEKMNNIPQQDLDIYNSEFKQLCELISDSSPNNLNIKLSKIRDSISQKEILSRFEKDIKKLRSNWNTLPQDIRNIRINKAQRNLKTDFNNLNDNEKYKILLESTLVHDAFIFGDWEEGIKWAFENYMIPIGFRYTGDWGIQIYSAKGSAAQFWIGFGVFEISDRIAQKIYTYSAYEKYLNKITYVRSNNVPENLYGLIQAPILIPTQK